jgi:hypothetical protein
MNSLYIQLCHLSSYYSHEIASRYRSIKPLHPVTVLKPHPLISHAATGPACLPTSPSPSRGSIGAWLGGQTSRGHRIEDEDRHHHWRRLGTGHGGGHGCGLPRHGDEGAGAAPIPPGAVAEAHEWQRRVHEVEARVCQLEELESGLRGEIRALHLSLRAADVAEASRCATDAEAWL